MTQENHDIKRDKRAKLVFGFCLFLAAACGASVLYYIWFPARTTFYADCSDTLYWANASYEAGAVFSREFYYATLQPFGGSLLMLPFVALLGFGLKAHLLGMVVFALLFMAGLWFFCSSLDISTNNRLLLFSAVLMVLSSSFKLRELMWEHVIYYSLGILFAMLLLGLCFRLQRRLGPKDAPLRQWQAITLLALLFLLAVGIGTDGMQVLVLCAVPLLLALFAERFFDLRSRVLGRKNAVALLLAGVIALGTGAGLVLLRFLSAGITTSYTDQHMVFSPSAQWGEHLLLLPDFWARLMGFNSHSGQDIVSAGGLVELLRLFVGLLIVILPVIAACNYTKIKDRQFRIILWFHGFLCAILLLSHIVGSTANANWRFTPVVFSGTVVTVLYLGHLWRQGAARRVTGLLAAGLALLCAVNLFTMVSLPVRDGQNQHFYALVDTLEKNGLTYGFADFQVSQPVTVLSDNRVKARYVYMDENGVNPFYYQTEKDWYDDVPGQEQYFLVLDAGQYDAMKDNENWRYLEGILQQRLESGPYEILVFGVNPINPANK